jgi:hypothetical protein
MGAKVFGQLCLGVTLTCGLTALASEGTANGELPSQTQPLPSNSLADLRRIRGQVPRIWTEANQGRQASAVLLAANESSARLQKADERVVTIGLDLLSAEDQDYIRAALREASFQSNRPTPAKTLDLSQYKLPELSPLLPVPPPETVPWNMVYVCISRSFINRHLAREVSRQDDVSETILGRQVVGKSQTLGRLETVLQPSTRGAMVELQFRGTSTSNTTAYARFVQIFSLGVTQFESRKAIRFGDDGLHLFPAATDATTRSTTSGIATDLPGLCGRLATRIAANGVEASRNEVDWISSGKAAMRISRGFDRTLDQQVQELNQVVLETVADFRADLAEHPVGFHFLSTADRFQIVMLRPGGNRDQIVTPPMATAGLPDIEVHMHTAFVDRVVNSVDLRRHFQPFLELLPVLESLALSKDADPRAEISKYRWSPDRQWLNVVWDADGKPDYSPRSGHNRPGSSALASRSLMTTDNHR